MTPAQIADPHRQTRSNYADALLRVGDGDSLELNVLAFEGEEALGRHFAFEVVAAIESELADSLTEASLVGERAALHLLDTDRNRRVIRGIVSDAEYAGTGHSHIYLKLRLSPKTWLLTQRVNSRIFQQLATPDILRAVLADHNLVDAEVHFALKESYAPRDYCVQYRESDWDFLARLMEEEGMYSFVRENDGDAVLHITDGPHGHFDIQFGRDVRFHAPEGMTPEPGTVHHFALRRQIRPGKFAQTDYAAVKPSMPLGTRAEATARGPDRALEVFDFPGEYRDKSLGQRLARVRLEELRTGCVEGRGRATRPDFAPGRRFRLCDHALERCNAEYLLVCVHHRGLTPMAEQLGFDGLAQRDGQRPRPSYENEFRVIPADQVFRPARTTVRPRVAGPQTAVVVGPDGKEIYTDKHGRVKVRFRWDRDEQLVRDGRKRSDSSCWIRVSQLWAGVGYGGITIPRIGQEVIVDFLEGDPDQPIITGRVYNGEANAPQSMAAPLRMTGKGPEPIAAMQDRPQHLPRSATRTSIRTNSTPGGGGANEITLDDEAGSELVYVNATKDSVRAVGNNDTTTVAKNRDVSVGVNLDEFVGADRNRHVGANETVQVKANQDVTVDANRSITVKGNESHTVMMCRAKQVLISENILTGVSKTVETGLAHIETVGLLHALLVGMQRLTAVGMNDDLIVGADKCDKIYGNYLTTVANEMGISAGAKLVVECPDITLASKGGFIRIDGNGVTIKGHKVKINCKGAEAGKLSGKSSATGAGNGSGTGEASGSAGVAAGIAPGGCAPSIPTQGGLGGLLEGLGLGGFDGLLTELGIDPKGPLGQVLGAIGQILPKIPGIDSNISSLLNTVLNNGVPSLEEIAGAVRNRLPKEAQSALDAIIQAIRQGTNPPPLPGRPTNPALPGAQGQAGVLGGPGSSGSGPGSPTFLNDPNNVASGSGAGIGGAQVAAIAAATGQDYKDRGVTYQLGASAANGGTKSDCSHFVHHVMQQAGVNVPYETTSSILNSGSYQEVTAANAQPGDVLVQGGHMGVYAGTTDSQGRPQGWQMGNNGAQLGAWGPNGWFYPNQPLRYFRPVS